LDIIDQDIDISTLRGKASCVKM